MVELRDYQQTLLRKVRGALEDGPDARVMLQLPTGAGKTCIAGELLSSWLEDGRKAVWLTHRRELATQTEGMLRVANVSAMSNIQWTPGDKAPVMANGVVILMAQTVSRRTGLAVRGDVWGDYEDSDLMIIDEAHHATATGWARAIDQWPGRVMGMTATPWRLSEREGFDHLFEDLHRGPQVADLQSDKWLCHARVLSPPDAEQIQGGQVESTGDYSESGIEGANENRDIWTAGALRFWQKHGDNRRTIVYAVSVRHARNLVGMFNKAGIPAGILLSDTPPAERAESIDQFRRGALRALINVGVATEGFDLPDAACVVLTRPTMSLALYLQMVGRGLRPKRDPNDCLILDMAGNSLRHGLPEEHREWSLRPRGEQAPPGEPPVVRCSKCECLSPAASHVCSNCGEPYGELCGRCGAWRASKRWSRKNMCGQDHDLVCDLCHYDAHIEARLPVTEELKELSKLADDDALSPQRDQFLRDLLEEERRRASGGTEERKDQLRRSIERRESELQDDDGLSQQFERHLDSLPCEKRPQNVAQMSDRFVKWRETYEAELNSWKNELANLEAKPIDKQLVFSSAKDRVLRLLEAEARVAGLLPLKHVQQPSEEGSRSDTPDSGGWMTLVQLEQWLRKDPNRAVRTSLRCLQVPRGASIFVDKWVNLLAETAEWLVQAKLLTRERGTAFAVGRMATRYLIHTEPTHPSGRNFYSNWALSNGLHVECNHGSAAGTVRVCMQLVKEFDQDPAEFRVQIMG